MLIKCRRREVYKQILKKARLCWNWNWLMTGGRIPYANPR